MKKYFVLLSFTLTPFLNAEPVAQVQQTTEVTSAFTNTTLPLESILNLFIQEHAPTNLNWQVDLAITNDPDTIKEGRFIGKAEQINAYYTYRPITFAELSSLGKNDLYQDPRLLPWIEWFSGKQRLAPIIGKPQPITTISTNAVIAPADIEDTNISVISDTILPLDKKYLYTVPTSHIEQPNALHIQLNNE